MQETLNSTAKKKKKEDEMQIDIYFLSCKVFRTTALLRCDPFSCSFAVVSCRACGSFACTEMPVLSLSVDWRFLRRAGLGGGYRRRRAGLGKGWVVARVYCIMMSCKFTTRAGSLLCLKRRIGTNSLE
jgi:hypothetical protein